MTLKKIQMKAGINRENTRYTNEGGWYACDNIRFRQGFPEKIGGWARISGTYFLGVARSLWNWVTLGGSNLLGIGTNLKFYIESGGVYNDITPLRATVVLNAPFTATLGSTLITVTDAAGGYSDGDYVTFSGAVSLGGSITAAVLNQEYALTVTGASTYTIDTGVAALAADVTGSPGGGAAVSAAYQVDVGPATAVPLTGWGGGAWGGGVWGVGAAGVEALRVWTQASFGEDLIFGPRGGKMYYWAVSGGLTARGVLLSSLAGASDVPTIQNGIFVSDVSRFVFALGANNIGSPDLDRMLIRWSDQESAVNWTPAATNQAGDLRLSKGSSIVTAIQSRQELLVFTDSSLYSLQYVGPPVVWGAQLVGENISICSTNAVAAGGGAVFWMGIDKFYKYDGRIQTLRCDLRQHVYGDINRLQLMQVACGTNEGFNEVWWFYCSAESTANDRYVTYNYAEDVWAYGSMARTAWLDSGLRPYPLAATTINNIVSHEEGVDDNSTDMPVAINAFVTSAEFDLDDGHRFMFVSRILPDMTFRGSSAASPSATMYLYPLKSSGSGYTNPASTSSTASGAVTRSVAAPVEEFTGIIDVRLRGRQMAMKIESTALGVAWQLGSPRIDGQPDGRR